MKAYLLAAGEGVRLRPLTLSTPKCLVPVGRRSLIEYWFDLFELYGIDEVLINTSHLSEKVEEYLKSRSREFKITLAHEKKLLGSGGTIKENWDFVKGEETFFIFYADNLTNINLGKMLAFHREKEKDFTLALFRAPNPAECGIAEMGESSSVISFEEKPEQPLSDLAFAGVMLGGARLVDCFPDTDVFDLGQDVLPCLVGKAAGYVIEDYLMDVGTPDNLRQAEEDIDNNIFAGARGDKEPGRFADSVSYAQAAKAEG